MKDSREGKPKICAVRWYARSGPPYRMWKCDRPGTLPGFGYIPEAAYEVWALRNKRDAG
jgi:hypothetical protein